MKQGRLAVEGEIRRRVAKAQGRKVPGEVNPDYPDFSGDVARGVQNLMGGVTCTNHMPLRWHGCSTRRRAKRRRRQQRGSGSDGSCELSEVWLKVKSDV